MLFDWYAEVRKHKPVKLKDVIICKPVTCKDVALTIEGMGLTQWETYMSHIWSEAVLKALERGDEMADVTRMFSCDLVKIDEHGPYTKFQREISHHLMQKLFKTVKETEEEMIVSLRREVFVTKRVYFDDEN